MKKFRNCLCILLIALMLGSLFAGCGNGGTTQEVTPTDTAAATATAKGEEPAFDKLDVSMFTGGYTDMWKDLLALFSTYYPNVEITSDLSDDNASRVRARMLTDDPPDVVFTSGQEFNPWEAVNSGLYMPLDDFFATGVTADGRNLSDIINPSMLDNGKVGGTLYMPTICTYYGGWWYDQALFDKNGWTVPTTWDELCALAPKISATGIAPFIYQGSKAANYLIWGYLYSAVAAAGGYEAWENAFINLAEGSWTSDAMKTAATNLYNLVKDGYMYEGAAGIEFTQAQIEFVNDRAAMIPCGSWFENEMKDSTPSTFKMSFMPLPMTDSEGNHYLCTFDTAIGIPAKAKNPEAAKAFLGVIYSKEGQKICAKYGNTPVANDITADDIAEYITPCWKTVIETANQGKIKFVNNNPENWYASMWPDLQDNIVNLSMMEITPDQFCSNMEAIVKAAREDNTVVKYYTKDYKG